MGRNFIVFDENPTWWHLGRFVQIKNTRVWETQDRIGIVRPGDSSEEVRTWLSQIENYGEEKYRGRNSKRIFGIRNGNFEKNAVVKNQGTKQRVPRILGDCWQWEFNGQCVKGNNCSFRHDMDERGKVTPSYPSPNSFMQQKERKASRTRSPRGRSPSGRMYRWPCKDYLRGTCNNSFCEQWHPPECWFYKTKSGCWFGEKCSYAHCQVDEQLTERSEKNDDNSAVAILKKNDWLENVWQLVVNRDKSQDRTGRLDKKRDTCQELKRRPTGSRSSHARQLGCVCSDTQKPIQRVKFKKATARHTTIRDQNPSLEYICPGEPQQRSSNAPKFEDRSLEETAWQEEGAREAACKLSKSVLNFKERERATFFSLSENTMPAKMITYRFFCFEGLIIEFVEITYRFPSLMASFSSQVKKCLKPVLFSRGAVFESSKNTKLILFLI